MLTNIQAPSISYTRYSLSLRVRTCLGPAFIGNCSGRSGNSSKSQIQRVVSLFAVPQQRIIASDREADTRVSRRGKCTIIAAADVHPYVLVWAVALNFYVQIRFSSMCAVTVVQV